MSKARCKLCGDTVESKHRHDFVTCECGKMFLDGGDSYLRGNDNTIVTEFNGKPCTDKDWGDEL